MHSAMPFAAPTAARSSDMALVARALAGDPNALRAIMTTYNQKLYRMARSILRDDGEAEDCVQDAYVLAFTHLDRFRGEAALSTWLCRIVMNEALGRLRRRRRAVPAPAQGEGVKAEIIAFPMQRDAADPERRMAQRQILELVERATDKLPDVYRSVFVARVIEGMSAEQTAELLGIRPQTAKTRLHRARSLLRKELEQQIGPLVLDAFPFAGRRCERLTAAVMRRLGFPA